MISSVRFSGKKMRGALNDALGERMKKFRLELSAFRLKYGARDQAIFRLTKNIYNLWPIFRSMGQLVTLIKDGLELSLIVGLDFWKPDS